MASIKLENVHKMYPGNDSYAVTDFNLEIEDGEFIVFVGPSGCGKSTTLRMIAGLEDITEGFISIDDRVVNDVEPIEISQWFSKTMRFIHICQFMTTWHLY